MASSDKRMMFCKQPWCRAKTRHERDWHYRVTLGGSVYAFACVNCGEVKVPRAPLISMPNEESCRFADKDERRLLHGRLS
jgi:hypothetical protein